MMTIEEVMYEYLYGVMSAAMKDPRLGPDRLQELVNDLEAHCVSLGNRQETFAALSVLLMADLDAIMAERRRMSETALTGTMGDASTRN